MFDNQSSTSHDLQVGAQIAQQWQQNQQRAQQMAMQQEAMRIKTEGNKFLSAGAIELGRLMEEGGVANSYADPAFEGKLWSIGQRYPQLLESDTFKGAIQVTENAKKAKDQLAEIRLRNQTDTDKPPADVQKLQYLNAFERNAKDAEAKGDTEAALEYRRAAKLLEGTFMSPTETFETFTDDQGNTGFRLVRGGAGTDMTTAAKTDLQKRMLNFENMSSMSKRLLDTLGPLDVGVAGWGQQVLVNEGLAQVFPGLASQSTTDARSLLGIFNESMIKALKADSQVNKQEEARILSILPKPGLNESFPDATAKIVRAMRELHSLSLPVAKRIGQPAPEFPLSADEIKALYKSGKLTDRELVGQLLRTYYPDVLKPFEQQP